jgi:4-amino-4-deoxy-L-arabinose transferase-like glycosyltransferase
MTAYPSASGSPPPLLSSPPARSLLSSLREIEIPLLLLLIALIYTTRISSPPVRGEESRRATATIYFLETGNWIVPQQQGNTLYMSARPPLQNWLMLAFYAVAHTMDAAVIRAPSILAVFLTSLLLYLYGRAWMSRLGAFAAALAFPTMAQVMELGRTAETDLVLTFFLTAGLLAWHYLYELRRAPTLAWTLGYAAIAAATLTKGLQAPVYFLAATCAYLWWTRQLRSFFTLRHALGLLVYALLVAAWLLPYYLRTDLQNVRHIFTGDVDMYGHSTGIGAVASHLTLFPLTLLASLLPWILLLILFFRRSVRDQSRALAQPLAFAALTFILAFPTVWLMIGSRPRFLLNMFPCAAIVIGIAVDRAFAALDQLAPPTPHDSPPPKKSLSQLLGTVQDDLLRFSNIAALVIIGTALTLLVMSLIAALKHREILLAMTLPRAAVFTAASLLLALLAWRQPAALTPRAYARSLFCIAAFLGLLYNLPVVDDLNRKSQRVDLAFAQLYDDHLLPPGQTLVSLDESSHLINYLHYLRLHATIPKLTLPQIQALQKTHDVYFIATSPQFPLPYTPIATLSLERYRTPNPTTIAVIGKLPAAN